MGGHTRFLIEAALEGAVQKGQPLYSLEKGGFNKGIKKRKNHSRIQVISDEPDAPDAAEL